MPESIEGLLEAKGCCGRLNTSQTASKLRVVECFGKLSEEQSVRALHPHPVPCMWSKSVRMLGKPRWPIAESKDTPARWWWYCSVEGPEKPTWCVGECLVLHTVRAVRDAALSAHLAHEAASSWMPALPDA